VLLLGWLLLLDVADPNEGEEAIEMPLLALERDVEDRPVVDELCGDDLRVLAPQVFR
jgi:hypothetical protein